MNQQIGTVQVASRPKRFGATGLKLPGGGDLIEIGAAGFEPTTPTTPKWCATKLRYAPNIFT